MTEDEFNDPITMEISHKNNKKKSNNQTSLGFYVWRLHKSA